jgi:ABC-type multidrug transport system fused ATPase/permease subunit
MYDSLTLARAVFYGGLLVRNGDMTSGQMVSFLLYLQSLSDAFASLGWIFSSLTQAVGAADKVFELLHRKPRITPPSQNDVPQEEQDQRHPAASLLVGASSTSRQRLQGIVPETARGKIELRDVVLYYPARPQHRVLDGLSLKIEPGSIVALVGQSGGGKSSVMSLILHQYEQQTGHVLLDGTAVHELSPSWLSRHVSIVSQEPTLFGRSIRKNIMYGLEGTEMEPTQEEIEEAARLANADAFIQKMPQKYVRMRRRAGTILDSFSHSGSFFLLSAGTTRKLVNAGCSSVEDRSNGTYRPLQTLIHTLGWDDQSMGCCCCCKRLTLAPLLFLNSIAIARALVRRPRVLLRTCRCNVWCSSVD